MKKRVYRGAVKKLVLLMTLAGLVCGGKGAGVSAAESVAEDSYAMTAESAAEGLSSKTAESSAEAMPDDEVQVSRIRFASDYTEVYEALKTASEYRNYIIYEDYDRLEDAVAYEEAAVSDSKEAAVPEHSETNVRTEGVDEADLIKTDGRYIYILRDQRELVIVRAEGADLREISSTVIADEGALWNGNGAREFFVSGDRLYVIYQDERELMGDDFYRTYSTTSVLTYDISDPEHVRAAGSVEQDGNYRQARMKDGYLYLFTEWYPEIGETEEESEFKVSAGGETVPPGQICIPDIMTEPEYLIVSAIDAAEPSAVTDTKVLISGAEQLYVSSDSIYAVNVNDNGFRSKTEIVKFVYRGGDISGKAAGTLRGTVDDTFSVDEYKGNLRVLTSYTGSARGEVLEVLSDIFGFGYEGDWTRYNALTVLDPDMHRIGRIADLAPGEEIKSARFFGDTAYFVTFRNTDPLFTADLSDPEKPVITGECKLPGFSEYLHPMGENLLAGLGYDADEESGAVSGVKISLFDISDPAETGEIGKALIPGVTYFPVLENYKAVFADAGKGLIGFCLNDRYLLYRAGENGIERVLLYDFYEDSLPAGGSGTDVRGLYIGDVFYVAGGRFVAAFDMNAGFEKKAVLPLS